MECCDSGFGTWFPLQQACSASMSPFACPAVPRETSMPSMQRMVYLDVTFPLLFGNGLPNNDQVTKLGPTVCVGSDWGSG